MSARVRRRWPSPAKATQCQTLAQSPPVVDEAYRLSGLKPEGSITVAVPLDTPEIRFRVVRRDPVEAAKLANSFIDSPASAVKKIENGTVDGSAQVGLESVVKIQTYTPASPPTIPSSPRVKLGLALGLLLGLIAGGLYAATRAILDRRIRNEEVVERVFGVSVNGLIPIHERQEGQRRVAGVETRATGGAGFRTIEAFKELRTNLQFMNPGHPPRVIAVTSPLPSEGKSTVALNVAVTIASRGQSVVLVDGDLRRPTVAKSFGLLEGVGLVASMAAQAGIRVLVVKGRHAAEQGLRPARESTDVIGELPLIVSGAVRDVMFSAESAEGDPARLQQAARLTTLLTLVASLGLGVTMAWWLPWVFGREFAPALWPAIFILVATVVGSTGSVAGAGLGGRGRPGLRSWARPSPARPRWRCRSRHTASGSRSSATPSSRSPVDRSAPAG
jgi:hypothetical protein